VTRARELLDPAPLVVDQATPVRELASLLLSSGAEGACVLESGRLVGVVTAMDLVFQEKDPRLPSLFTFMDAVIPLGWKRVEEELHKIAGVTVGQIMSAHPVTVGPDEDLHRIATLMVERHLSMVPVVEDGLLLGVVDKRRVLKAAFPPVT
jgi:CBS domain-containing protein